MEGLDVLFENACELDLVYYPDKVSLFIDELISGGTVLETNLQEIVHTLKKKKAHEEANSL